MQGRLQRFAEFDPAAGQRVKTPGRRPRAPYQEDPVVAKDRGADRELGMGRRRRRCHGYDSRKWGPVFEKRSCLKNGAMNSKNANRYPGAIMRDRQATRQGPIRRGLNQTSVVSGS